MFRCTSGLRTVGSFSTAPSASASRLSGSLQRLSLRDSALHNKHNVTRIARLSTLPRLYATPGRPKTDTGATRAPRKSVNKTPAKVAAAKKAAASKKKPAKKTAKKVAKKPVKRVLTAEQKEKKKAAATVQKQKDEIKRLKEVALLKDEPNKSGFTAYNLFNKQFQGAAGQGAPQRIKAVVAEWKSLSSSEIEKLNHEANRQRQEAEKAYSSWLASIKPADVVAANNARRTLKRKDTSRVKRISLIKDERLPKRPSTPFNQFTNERHASGDLKNISIAETGVLLGKEWRQLSAGEKQKYEDLYQADKKRYIREYTDVYGRAPETASISASS